MSNPTSMQPILVDGRWVQAQAPAGSFHAFDPSQGKELDAHDYPISGWADLDAMLDAGQRAAAAMATLPGERIGAFLERETGSNA